MSACSPARKWFRFRVLGLLSWTLAQLGACTQFHVCYDRCNGIGVAGSLAAAGGGVGGAPASGNAGSPSSAGVAGADELAGAAGNALSGGGNAGAAGDGGAASACTKPLADCDESTLNGCETDLLTDPGNCGACSARCAGICAAGTCHAFEVLMPADGVPDQGGIAFTSQQVYALAANGSVDGADLLSAAKDLGQTATLLSHGPDVDRLLAGVDRVYSYSAGFGDTLWSVALSGSKLQDEALDINTAAVAGSYLYYLDARNDAYRRNELTHEIEPLPLDPPLPVIADVKLTSLGDAVALAVTTGSGNEPTSYTLFSFDALATTGNRWRTVGTGSGTPTHLRLTGLALYTAVVPDAAAAAAELRETRFDGSTRVLSRAPVIVDFAIYSDSVVYLSWAGDHETSGLRVIPVADPTDGALDYRTFGALRSLAIDGQSMYFGDPERRNLSRLTFWLNQP